MPSYYREAEIQAMLNEFGVDVVVGGTTVKAIVDRTDEEMIAAGFGTMVGKGIVVTAKTGAFTISEGAAITVEGTGYKMRESLQAGDGALTRIFCAVD